MWVKLTTPGEEESKSKLNLKGRSQPDVYLWVKPHRGLVLLLFVGEVVIAEHFQTDLYKKYARLILKMLSHQGRSKAVAREAVA